MLPRRGLRLLWCGSIGFHPPYSRPSRQVSDNQWLNPLRSQRLCVEKIASCDSELEMER